MNPLARIRTSMLLLVLLCLAPPASAEPFSWLVGDWGECSVTCGGGTQTRVVICIDEATGQGVADSFCTGTPKPASAQPCGTQACPVFVWQTGAWGECSAGCGGGTQLRTVVCIELGSGTVAPDASCAESPKPPSSQACNSQPCPVYAWQTSDWGVCSLECGGGTQMRNVVCVETGSNQVVADAFCAGTSMPPSSQVCNSQPCPVYLWQTSAWGECSVGCGEGTQMRSVTCIDSVTGGAVVDAFCSATPRPLDAQGCMEAPCIEIFGDGFESFGRTGPGGDQVSRRLAALTPCNGRSVGP